MKDILRVRARYRAPHEIPPRGTVSKGALGRKSAFRTSGSLRQLVITGQRIHLDELETKTRVPVGLPAILL